MLIGRIKEVEILNQALRDDRSHFIAIYGRRRIGKTFLVRETLDYRMTFQHTGIFEGSLENQLFAFSASLKEAGLTITAGPKNWAEAFECLKDLIRQSTEKRKTVFLDELSWMDTPRSDLIPALESFWNGWASARKDVILIICASATSWMLSRIIHSKGGLYNRLTEQLHLEQFTLAECEDFVQAGNLHMTRNQILQYYMIFGGVPYYWTLLQKGLSVSQNIDRILFAQNAPLKEEYRYLYASVFKRPEIHLKIVEALGKKKAGMTREELIKKTGIPNSGDLTRKLEELEACGFIRKYTAFGMKTKNSIYQLMDGFTLFHYQFLMNSPTDEHFWTNQINTPTINTWAGLAFERVCLLHIKQIKQKLGISGVITEENAWHCKADPDRGIVGSQIDLLIVRKDQVINLCEMKYADRDYTITKQVDQTIRDKINDLQICTGTKYAVYPTLITTYGLTDNVWSNNIVSVVVLDDLFAI